MPIPINVCCFWPGTNASIPAGWAKETLIGNSQYPKGAAAGIDPGATGGTLALHDHANSAGHTHTGAHTHTVPTSAGGVGTTARDSGTANPPTAHTHTSPDSGAASTGLASNTFSTPSVVATLAFFRLIVIKSDGTPAGFPDLSVVLWNDSSADPTGWGLCDGGGAPARPNITATYARQALAGGDGGGTGGNLAHEHVTAISFHTHTNAHTHTGTTTSAPVEALVGGPAGGPAAATALGTHTHATTVASSGSASGDGSINGASANHEPPFYTLAFEQNTTGADSWPDRIIGLWMQTLASIPTDWALCDGTLGTPDLRSRFIKGAATLAGIGTTGGSLNHTHPGTAHTHPGTAHTHSVTWAAGAGENVSGGATNCATTAHTHAAANSGSTSFTSGSATPVLDDFTNTQPTFTGVAYIQWQEPPAGQPFYIRDSYSAPDFVSATQV